MKWYSFDASKGSHQKLPPEKKYVCVLIQSVRPGFPNPVMAGYLKYAAGDKQSPHFIIPGYPQPQDAGLAVILSWCDCLVDFEWPLEVVQQT